MERKSVTGPSVLRYDTTPADEVRAHFEASFTKRTYNPLEDPLATAALKSQVENWKNKGKTVVFTSGVYDLFHANHRTYLLHTKLAAAPVCWESQGERPAWTDLMQEERRQFAASLLERDMLRLVVSVDGNMSVGVRKGGQPEKGGYQRPVYDWTTRANDVLSAGLEISTGSSISIADIVTIHDNVQPELNGGPHGGIMGIASFIEPDVWSIYYESEDIIEALQTTHADDFRDTAAVILSGNNFYHDALIGGPFTTTNITRRLGETMLSGEN